MSHISWMDVASKSAAYSLSNHQDQNVLNYINSNVDTSMVLGADDATATDIPNLTGSEAVHIGFGSNLSDPLNLISRLARWFDDNDVPEEDRWFVAPPTFYEVLADTASKLLDSDYNAGQGSLRNGLISSGLLRGFKMYKSTNLPSPDNAEGVVLAGHKSAVASGGTLLNTETLRHQDSFGDMVRGLHVFGRKVLREDALALAYWSTTTDT